MHYHSSAKECLIRHCYWWKNSLINKLKTQHIKVHRHDKTHYGMPLWIHIFSLAIPNTASVVLDHTENTHHQRCAQSLRQAVRKQSHSHARGQHATTHHRTSSWGHSRHPTLQGRAHRPASLRRGGWLVPVRGVQRGEWGGAREGIKVGHLGELQKRNACTQTQ